MNGDTPLPRGQNSRQRRILGHQKIAGRGAHEDLDPRRARQAFQFRKLLRIRGGRADIEGMIAPHAMMAAPDFRSEEHTSELQSLMRISYAVFCLTKKKQHTSPVQ